MYEGITNQHAKYTSTKYEEKEKTLHETASVDLKAELRGVQRSAPRPSTKQQRQWQGIPEVQEFLRHPDIDPLSVIRY